MEIYEILAGEFGLKAAPVNNIIGLVDAGNTIPFIARYRKEMTGGVDDQVLRGLCDRLESLRALEKRRDEVRAAILAQEKLTEDIAAAINAALNLSELEDIYRPFRPKRKTRASVARERGLEPLAGIIFKQERPPMPLQQLLREFVDAEKGVPDAESALEGALDIIAEGIADDTEVRKRVRAMVMRGGSIVSKAKTEDDTVYRMYYDFSEPVGRIQSHRVLALNRGEKEGALRVSVSFGREAAVSAVCAMRVRPGGFFAEHLERAIRDACDRLLFPSIEREVRAQLTTDSSEQAIKMFAINLRDLLMQPPVKGKVALGLDPAYRTGCKLAVVDATGALLDTAVIYPTPPQKRVEEAEAVICGLIERHGVEIIAIGNGTASKEAEIFAAEVVKKYQGRLSYMVVSEAGASVYSASKLAADELPGVDVSLRSAASIARRLQDPLAELVKIDPKAIGVGQYQHDMPPARLDTALEGVVEDCVNSVGVDLNTASPALLSHIAGLSAAVAKNIAAFRDENGPFRARSELKKVSKLGPRAFEQCAGFLRIPGARNILDNTSVHPESYGAAGKLLKLCGYSEKDVASGSVSDIAEKLRAIGEERAASDCDIGVPTLRDIASELRKPGRDSRDELPPPLLRTDVLDIGDLVPGMRLRGTVRNVIDFGAFVDIGVHQDGLVHISELGASRYVRHPSEVVRIGDIVDVTVLEADAARKRISLSMRPEKDNSGK